MGSNVSFNKTGVVVAQDDEVNKNLCLDTLNGRGVVKDTYAVGDFNLSESLIADTQYTISANIDMSDEKKSMGFFLSGGSMGLVYWLQKNDSGIYSGTFTATSTHASNTAGSGHGFIRVYVSNNTATQGSTAVTGIAEVKWLKIEKGSLKTPWVANVADEDNVGTFHGFIEGSELMKVYHNHIDTNEFIEW